MSGYPSRKYHTSRMTEAELRWQLNDLDKIIRQGALNELNRRGMTVEYANAGRGESNASRWRYR